VPIRSKSFYKFWWCQELNTLKENAVLSGKTLEDRDLAQSLRPHTSKLTYKRRIREYERQARAVYTNDQHEALLGKKGPAFWKCWRSKFDCKNRQDCLIDGTSNEKDTIEKFVDHFKKTGCNLTVSGNQALYDKYVSRRSDYIGTCHNADLEFDVSLVDNVIADMKRGKASGLDGLSAEHLQYSHPAICLILSKLFNFIIEVGYVPDDFGLAYTVPLPKISNFNRSVTVDDFRGISISQVISKVFETFFLVSSDNKFGFKHGLSCSHAIYILTSVVNGSGSTVNLCALDVKKAFDRLNHYG